MKTKRNFCKAGVAAPRQKAASIISPGNAAVCRQPLRNVIQIWLLCALLLQAVTSGAQPVTRVAGGGGHSLFLKGDGSLWAMGENYYGQLGDGTYGTYPTEATNRPEQIVTSGVTTIAGGGGFSLFLKSDGSLWAMGDNYYGELGDGTTDNGNYSTNRPEKVVPGGVTAIAAGWNHSLFLKTDGSLWGMGRNDYGELGDGTYPDYGTNRPEQIVASGVKAIAAGAAYSLFLKTDGSLWGMGYNGYGQLGDGTYGTYPKDATNRPEQILTSGVMAIAAGASHSLFLKSDGSLWAMGDNEYGQLGDGTYTTTPTAPSGLWPVASRPLPQDSTTACSSKATAACGTWATIAMVRWATVLTTTPTAPSRFWLLTIKYPNSF
ncbi:MAG: hypothetical protein WBN75_02780 [Verrucomicrobiia bacterium]